ncbi:F21 protein [Hirschfeldia incana]|nr:F21 protein [Hirschfeldia incana]
MTRQKVKMAFIENESSRKATYKKRKSGILKKANELATLCGVPVGVIIDSEYDLRPEVWPSREEMGTVLSRWQRLPVIDRTKKMLNQQSYLQQRITKETDTCKKLTKENKELEMKEVMFDCLSGKTSPSRIEISDLRGCGNVIEQYLKNLNRRIEILSKNDGASSSSVHAAATTTSVAMPIVEMGSSSSAFSDMIRQQQIQSNMNQTVRGLDLNQQQW